MPSIFKDTHLLLSSWGINISISKHIKHIKHSAVVVGYIARRLGLFLAQTGRLLSNSCLFSYEASPFRYRDDENNKTSIKHRQITASARLRDVQSELFLRPMSHVSRGGGGGGGSPPTYYYSKCIPVYGVVSLK